jgi:hypothetical protein
MVPAITAGGRSFRGAALYYLHDKRQPGEAERLTTDRVAWVETLNLPTGDPERAWKIMAHRDRDHRQFREEFLKQCDTLRDMQARQAQELRTAWETRNAERGAALAPFADREATRRAGRAYGQGLTRSHYGDDRFGGPGIDGPKPEF